MSPRLGPIAKRSRSRCDPHHPKPRPVRCFGGPWHMGQSCSQANRTTSCPNHIARRSRTAFGNKEKPGPRQITRPRTRPSNQGRLVGQHLGRPATHTGPEVLEGPGSSFSRRNPRRPAKVERNRRAFCSCLFCESRRQGPPAELHASERPARDREGAVPIRDLARGRCRRAMLGSHHGSRTSPLHASRTANAP